MPSRRTSISSIRKNPDSPPPEVFFDVDLRLRRLPYVSLRAIQLREFYLKNNTKKPDARVSQASGSSLNSTY